MNFANNTNENVLIKLQYNNELRKFRIPANSTFRNFKQIIQSVLGAGVDIQKCVFSYIDESNDEINFDSDKELELALSSSPLRYVVKYKNVDEMIVDQPMMEEKKIQEEIVEVNTTTMDEMKERIKESNERIKSIKEEIKMTKDKQKDRNKEKGIINGGYFDEVSEEEKNERMALYRLSLELYNLKISRRSLFQQMKVNGGRYHYKGRRGIEVENEDASKLRQSVWELKEKMKGIKVQIRSLRLLMNSENSESQKSDLQNQLSELRNQMIELKQKKLTLSSQFRSSHRAQNSNDSDVDRKCGRGKYGGEERKQRKEQILALRKRIVEIKSIKDFQKSDELLSELESLKLQIQTLRPHRFQHINHPFHDYRRDHRMHRIHKK